MTIKQQGGIFGRNPTFNDVGASTVDTTDLYTNNISVGTDFQIEPVTLLRTLGNNANAPVIAGSAGAVDKYATIDVYRGNTSNQIGWTFYTYFGALAEAFTVTPSGNIAFPSGQGMDFSATSGTGTSELFDDYEEGTHTTTATPATSGTITLESSFNGDQILYTKIGQRVYCSAGLRINSLSSPVGSTFSITLPFSVASGSLEMRASGTIYDLGNSNLVGVLVSQGSSTVDVLIDPSTLVTGNGGILYLSINYIGA